VGGSSGLDRDVARSAILRTRAPAFDHLTGGELVLASLEVIRQLDERLSLGVLLRRLSDRRVSALAVLGTPDDDSRLAAEELALPLIRLPDGSSLYELDQTVSRYVYESRTRVYEQGLLVHQQLVELSISGRGITSVLERLAEMTGRTVVLQSSVFQVERWACPIGRRNQCDKPPELPDSEIVVEKLRGVPLLGSNPPVVRIEGAAGSSMVAPVVAGDSVSGYLWLVGGDGDLTDEDREAAVRGSVVCALELAKQYAIVEAEHRVRGDFFEDLLEGSLGEEALLSRARHLGFDVANSHQLILVEPDDSVAVQAARQRADMVARHPRPGMVELARSLQSYLGGRGVDATTVPRQRNVAVVCPLQSESDTQLGRALGRGILDQLGRSAGVSVGIARPHTGLEGLRVAYREAEQALAIGRHLHGGGHATSFSELGAYRLLFALRDSPELAEFCRESLAPLIEYDSRNGTELVKTLDAYFANGTNLQATADALFLHRNSLAYRLRRIEEVCGVDLDDIEDRFRLQLALKGRRMLT